MFFTGRVALHQQPSAGADSHADDELSLLRVINSSTLLVIIFIGRRHISAPPPTVSVSQLD